MELLKFLILMSTCFASFVLLSLVLAKIEDAKYRRNHRKWEQSRMVTKYRAHITCNDVIMARTFVGENHSDILDKAIDYSIKEENNFPDVIILKKDVIYL